MISGSRSPEYKVLCGGTHRTRPLEESLRLLAPLLRPCGITRVAVVTGLDVIGIPVVMVTRPAGRSLSVTQGKGVTLDAARVSGIMEGVEHFHAETIERPLRYTSYAELSASEPVVDVGRLPRLTSTRDSASPCLWIAGTSLQHGSPFWVPFECVHLDYRLPLPPGSGRFLASSNGLASGNSMLEATCHGLFEVIERHQAAAFYGLTALEQGRLRLDASSVSDSVCVELLQRIDDGGARAALWDLSRELGVPCFLCDLIDARPDAFRKLPRARGLGCHSDKGVALSRALTEAAQSRLTNVAGSRDDISPSALRSASGHDKWREAAQQHDETAMSVGYESIASYTFETFDAELQWALGRLTANGFEQAVVVDLSKPSIPFSVVRVVVPGLMLSRPPAAAMRER